MCTKMSICFDIYFSPFLQNQIATCKGSGIKENEVIAAQKKSMSSLHTEKDSNQINAKNIHVEFQKVPDSLD